MCHQIATQHLGTRHPRQATRHDIGLHLESRNVEVVTVVVVGPRSFVMVSKHHAVQTRRGQCTRHKIFCPVGVHGKPAFGRVGNDSCAHKGGNNG